MNVEELLLEGMLASSSISMSITDEVVNDAAANGRREGRGTWGNLWD